LGTGSDPRFNAASQAANNVSDKGWAQNIDYGTTREAWKESFPEGQMNFLDFAGGLDLPGQGFGQDDQSGQDAGGAGRHGSKAYWDFVDKSEGVGAKQKPISIIGSQYAADASIEAGWGQDYSVNVESDPFRLPNTEGQQTVPKMQVGANLNWGEQQKQSQLARRMGRKMDMEKDAAGRKITGEGSYYQAGPQRLYDDERRDYEQGQADRIGGGTNMEAAANIDMYDTGIAPIESAPDPDFAVENERRLQENQAKKLSIRRQQFKGDVEEQHGKPDPNFIPEMSMDRKMHLQALQGPDTSKEMYAQKETLDDWFRDQDMPEINMKEIMAGKDPQVTDMERRFDAGRAPTGVEMDAMGGGYEKGAKIKAQEIREAIESLQIPHSKSTVSSVITASLGVATVNFEHHHNWTLTSILNTADKALYDAKTGGRNRCVYTSLP